MSRAPIDERINEEIGADSTEVDIDEFDGPSGPPLSVEELGAARASLAQWQKPAAFKVSVGGFSARCTSKDWFSRPELKFLHEAFVLARFAL
jgi:hypothetical protein